MPDNPNYGIANAGSGNIHFADSPVSFGTGAPATARTGPTRSPSGPDAPKGTSPHPPITNTGTGDITFTDEVMSFGPGGVQRAGQGAGQESRWGDAPGGRTAPTRGGSGGGAGVAEFNDHAAIRRFAMEIDSLGEGSDFVQTIKACHGLDGAVRDFGGDMNLRMRAFVDAAIAAAAAGDALRESAGHVARLSQDLSGDE